MPCSQMFCIWTLLCQTGHIHARLFLLLCASSTRLKWLQPVGLASKGIAQDRAAQGSWQIPPKCFGRAWFSIWYSCCLGHPGCGHGASSVLLADLCVSVMLCGHPVLPGKGKPCAPGCMGMFGYQRYRGASCHPASPALCGTMGLLKGKGWAEVSVFTLPSNHGTEGNFWGFSSLSL